MFDDERDGMLRNDLFFLGTSVGFRTVCGDVSWDVGIESALSVEGSVGAVVGLMGLGSCEVSKHCLVRKRVRKAHAQGRNERAAALGDAPRLQRNLQLVFGVEDGCCKACGTRGWPRSTPVLLPLMWGGELPLRGQVFEVNMLGS